MTHDMYAVMNISTAASKAITELDNKYYHSGAMLLKSIQHAGCAWLKRSILSIRIYSILIRQHWKLILLVCQRAKYGSCIHFEVSKPPPIDFMHNYMDNGASQKVANYEELLQKKICATESALSIRRTINMPGFAKSSAKSSAISYSLYR